MTNNGLMIQPPIKMEPWDGSFSDQNSLMTADHFNLPHIKPEPAWDVLNNPVNNTIPSNNMQTAENGNTPPKKKRGRPKKVKEEPTENGVTVKQEKITDFLKVRKKHDRFKGMPEEEVLKRVLPDHVKEGLDILIVGINPGLTAAYVGHHYAGPGNHMWKCLFLSGLIPEQWNAYHDHQLLDYGIGFTNIVERTSRGSADLTRKEIQEGGQILKSKVMKLRPKIAAFNGKGIYEVFVGHKNFHIGKQPDPFPDCPETAVFVMPSSSARFTQLPRAIDKVPFYVALKKYRDYLRGDILHIDESEIYFPDLDLKVKLRPETIEAQQQAALLAAQNGTVKQEKKPNSRKRVKKEPIKNQGQGQNEVQHYGFNACQMPSVPNQPYQGFNSGMTGQGYEGVQIKQEPVQNGVCYESPYFNQSQQPQGFNQWTNQSTQPMNQGQSSTCNPASNGTSFQYSMKTAIKTEPGIHSNSVCSQPWGQPNYGCALPPSITSSSAYSSHNQPSYSSPDASQYGTNQAFNQYYADGNQSHGTSHASFSAMTSSQSSFNMNAASTHNNGMYSNMLQTTQPFSSSQIFAEPITTPAMLADVNSLIYQVKQEVAPPSSQTCALSGSIDHINSLHSL